MTQPLRVPLDTSVRLSEYDPGYAGAYDSKEDAKAALKSNVQRMAELQELLWAENKHALLIVLQAMDAGGKDGTIKHVMRGVNPQGCRVTGFKVPTPQELDHDYLWRIHKAVPGKGEIGIFNRSHYEDVLVVRVHNLVPPAVWGQRYDQINAFEKLLADTGTTMLKFFLYISKEEQKERFEERLANPAKNWKFSLGDLAERKRWDDYVRAYEDALTRCNTPWAPWFIVPANRKWYRNLAISQVIIETLEGLDMHFPTPQEDLSGVVVE
jgi:PPK2 family polyphosphate:nucleotide phosphotransferase